MSDDIPYTGNGRCFGEYACSCGKAWMSANSWRGKGQKCESCNKNVYAHTQRSLLVPKGNFHPSRPHQQHLCEMCKDLGFYCINYTSSHRSVPLFNTIPRPTIPRPTTPEVITDSSTSYSRPAIIVHMAVQQYLADGLTHLEASAQTTAIKQEEDEVNQDTEDVKPARADIKKEDVGIPQDALAITEESPDFKGELFGMDSEPVRIKRERAKSSGGECESSDGECNQEQESMSRIKRQRVETSEWSERESSVTEWESNRCRSDSSASEWKSSEEDDESSKNELN